MSGNTVLLDEHVGRVFEHVLSERGFDAVQAKDEFGEQTVDRDLLRWCVDNDAILVTHDASDFTRLHDDAVEHAGICCYREQRLPDEDPDGLARALEAVLTHYGAAALRGELVELQEWYDWLQR